MIITTFIGFINNSALLVSLVLIYDIVILRQPEENASSKQIPIGLILGLIGLAIMMNPWEFLPGIIFDTRSILLSVCGLFFGTVPTIIATTFTGGYRLYLGGVGAWTGFAVIVISGAVGLSWRHFMTKDLDSLSNRSLYLMGCVTHALMLFLMLTLPRTVAFGVLSKISLPVMLIFPLGTVLLGRLFINRRNRIKSEQLLKESEQRFQRAMNASQDGIFDWDLETKEIYYSPGWKRILGYEPNELPNTFSIWEELTHPDDLKASWTMMNEVVEGKRDRFEIEFRMKHKNGHWVDILSRSNLYKNELNGRVRVVGTHVDISKIKEVERELKARKEKHGAILESAMDGFWIVDTAGRFLEVNKTYCEMSGYEEEELLHMDISDVEDVKTAVDINAHMQNIQSKRHDRFESRHRRKDGSVFDVEVSVQYRPLDEPQCVVFIRDITERKRSEEALIQSEQKWRDVLVNTPQIGIALNPDAEIIFVNNHFLKLTGWKEDEVLGQNWFDLFIPEEIREEIRGVFATVMKSGETQGLSSYENEILAKDGRFLNISWSNVLTKNSEGEIMDVTCLGIDLTERRRAEEELAKREANYRLLVENQSDVVVKVDLEGRFLFVSPSYCRMFGKTEDELLNQQYMPLVHEEDREPTAKAMEALFSPPHTAYMEQRALTKTGWRWLAWADTAVLNQEGGVIEIIGVGRDITEKKEAEQKQARLENQFRQAQKMESVGRLAGGVAHDFNNMLGIILGNTEMAMEAIAPDDRLHDNLSEIFSAARRSADITRQLLAFARKQTIEPKVLDLNRTIKSMLKMLQRLIGEDIDLAWLPDKKVWPVRMDPSQIDQILANLSVNARDAIADVGKITIETGNTTFDSAYCAEHQGFLPGEFALLAVSDDGCGMDQETQANLFEPFFTTKGVDKGTGLGLATVYGIVKQNDGFINVYSEPDQGTTFRIYLPRYLAETESLEKKTSDKINLDGTETILLVEDEPSILKMTRVMLERTGYKVLAAGTPGEAIALAREHAGEIHLLMTDVVMPEMNGRDLAKNLLSLYPDLKRLFMSGYTANVIAHHGVLDEGVQFIQKPFSKQDLAIKVREALDEDNL